MGLMKHLSMGGDYDPNADRGDTDTDLLNDNHFKQRDQKRQKRVRDGQRGKAVRKYDSQQFIFSGY